MPNWLKFPLSRSLRPSLAFWFSRIARYATEPARPNLTEICDPCVNIFFVR